MSGERSRREERGKKKKRDTGWQERGRMGKEKQGASFGYLMRRQEEAAEDKRSKSWSEVNAVQCLLLFNASLAKQRKWNFKTTPPLSLSLVINRSLSLSFSVTQMPFFHVFMYKVFTITEHKQAKSGNWTQCRSRVSQLEARFSQKKQQEKPQ